MCDNRKKPQIVYIQPAVPLVVGTLALLVLVFFGAADTLGQLSQRPLAVLGKEGQCWGSGWACRLGGGALSSLPGWKAGEHLTSICGRASDTLAD